jgi:hypothetical protein
MTVSFEANKGIFSSSLLLALPGLLCEILGKGFAKSVSTTVPSTYGILIFLIFESFEDSLYFGLIDR